MLSHLVVTLVSYFLLNWLHERKIAVGTQNLLCANSSTSIVIFEAM